MIEMENEQRTELSELGEFALIDLLTEKCSLVNPSSVKGVGDDAAVIDNSGFQTIVVERPSLWKAYIST